MAIMSVIVKVEKVQGFLAIVPVVGKETQLMVYFETKRMVFILLGF